MSAIRLSDFVSSTVAFMPCLGFNHNESHDFYSYPSIESGRFR